MSLHYFNGSLADYESRFEMVDPPLCFSEADADLFTAALDAVLDEDPARTGGNPGD